MSPHVGAGGRGDEGAAGGGQQHVHLGGGHVEEVAGAPDEQVQHQGGGEDGGGRQGEKVEVDEEEGVGGEAGEGCDEGECGGNEPGRDLPQPAGVPLRHRGGPETVEEVQGGKVPHLEMKVVEVV